MTPLPTMLSFSFRGIFFSKWFPKWISGNISINIYEPVSFTKFDERDQIINFSDDAIKYDIIKYNYGTSSFKSNKVKLKLQRTQYLEKLYVLHVCIWSSKHNFENFKMLLEVCALVENGRQSYDTYQKESFLQNSKRTATI